MPLILLVVVTVFDATNMGSRCIHTVPRYIS